MKRVGEMSDKLNRGGHRLMKYVNLIVFTAFAVCMWIYFTSVPYYLDDVNFLWGALGDRDAPAENFTEMWGHLKHYIINTQNSRLANLLGGLLVLQPRWISGCVITAFLLVSVLAGYRLTSISLKSAIACWGLSLWIVAMPWFDDFETVVYQSNYVPSTAVALVFLICLRNMTSTPLRATFMFLFGMLVSAMHEGFGIPILIGMMFMIVVKRDMRRQTMIWGTVGLALGLLAAMTTPATLHRVSGAVSYDDVPKLQMLRGALRGSQAIWFSMIAVTVYISRYGWRRLWKDNLLIFLIVSGTVSVILGAYISMYPRALWWGHLSAMLILLRLSVLFIKGGGWLKKLTRIVGWLVFTVAVFALGSTVAGACRIKESVGAAWELKRTHPGEDAFVPMFNNQSLPTLSLFMLNGDDVYWAMMGEYTYMKLKLVPYETPAKIIPAELEYVIGRSGVPLDGAPEIRNAGGYLFRPAPKDTVKMEDFEMYGDIRFGTHIRKHHKVFKYRFTSKGDGKEYEYLFILYGGLIYNLNEVTGFYPESQRDKAGNPGE